MDCLRNQAFARSRFPLDQHDAVCIGDTHDESLERLHLFATPEQTLIVGEEGDPSPIRRLLASRCNSLGQHLLDGDAESLVTTGLLDNICRTGLDVFDGRTDIHSAG